MKKYIKPIYAGAYIDDNGHLQINTNRDKMYRDVVLYNQNTSGITFVDNIPIVYAYQYNPNCEEKIHTRFREELKHPRSVNHLDEFVETGIARMDAQVPLDNFDVIIHIKPSKMPSILTTMFLYLDEHSDSKFISLELIKEIYDNVSFDYDKAIEHLRNQGYDEDRISEIINRILAIFDENRGKLTLFEMKKFLPRSIRQYFSDYLKFANSAEEETYKALQGAEVLMFDDFLTSGATLKEAKRYLTAINPSNTLTGYVLIKQH